MKKFTKVVIAVCLAIPALSAKAQQVPMYTHYMYNTLVINPAYAGSRDALTITALHRSQWVDFKGAPVTQTLTLHTPLRNEHIGVGLSVSNDKIGPTQTTSVVGDFAFIMKMNSKSKLALGLSAGANIFQSQLSSVMLDEQMDPVFANSISNHVTPNFGFGAYYSRERFYAGVSVPNLLENNYSVAKDLSGNTFVGKEQRHYFLIAGTVIPLSGNLEFKPTGLLKVTPGAPIQGDVTASFIIAKRLLVGAMFRSGDAIGGLIGVDATPQFHIGYSYDWSYGLETPKYNKGSHEIVLRYDFIYASKKQIHSPRYF